MAAEMRAHLEMQEMANRAAGMSADEAHYAARRQFGGVDQIKETARDQRGWVALEQTLRDVRHAWRMLRRNPGFTAAAVSSLALCLGANATIFSMLYGLVIRPLPFQEAGQLVEIYNTFTKVGIPKLGSNLGQYLDFKANAPAFSTLGLWRLDYFALGDDAGASRVPGATATAEIFDLLQVRPVAGRFFTGDNHVPGADKVVVLAQSFWESHFHGDPGAVGRTVRIDGEKFEIIGVAPRKVEALDARVRLIRPLSWDPAQRFGHTGYSPQLFGRIRPTATIAQAGSQLTALEKKYCEFVSPGTRDFYDRTGHEIRVDAVEVQRAQPVRAALILLQGGALAVLLIGCVNVANLLLARTAARTGEFALRVALGASRGAVARQLLVESALLASLGAACGMLLAWAGLSAANRFTAQLLPDALPIGLNGPVLACMASVAVVVILFVGLLPVLHLLDRNLAGTIHLQSRTVSAGRGTRTLGGALVVVQMAFALILLAGAGLLLRSFANVLAVEPGFDPEHVIGARIAVPKEKEKGFPPRLAAALRTIPGVEPSLATTTPFVLIPPFQFSMPLGALVLRDCPLPAGTSLPSAWYCGVDPAYLGIMRLHLREGRWIDASDMESGRAVVVDESLTKRYFPGRSALGQRLVINGEPPKKLEDWKEIVGVVGNVRHNGIEDRSGHPFVYLPLTQMPLYGSLSVLVRTNRSEAEMAALLREKVGAVDPELPVFAVESMPRVIHDSFGNRRGILLLLMSFAGMALLLAAIGSYGVLAFEVSRRTREIGIRAAIGATRGQIIGLFLRQGLWKAGFGIAAGLAGAAALSRFVTGLLFEVQPVDPLVYAAVALVLATVAAVASWLPARRAAKVDPVIALRAE